jgi:hypothetical protein
LGSSLEVYSFKQIERCAFSSTGYAPSELAIDDSEIRKVDIGRLVKEPSSDNFNSHLLNCLLCVRTIMAIDSVTAEYPQLGHFRPWQ